MRPISLWSRRAARRAVPHSLRRRLRHPSWSWALTAGAALLTAWAVYSAMTAAAEGARRYGSPEPAVVATRDLAAGTVLGPDDLERRELPAGSLPDDRPTAPPVGRTLRAPLAAGQPLADAQLADAGHSGTAAAVGSGRSAVALPRGDHPLAVDAGDVVDLWGLDPAGGTVAEAASAATVLGVDETTIVVAVRRGEVGAVMAALVAGSVWPTLPG